jgi:hypothetical protein
MREYGSPENPRYQPTTPLHTTLSRGQRAAALLVRLLMIAGENASIIAFPEPCYSRETFVFAYRACPGAVPTPGRLLRRRQAEPRAAAFIAQRRQPV